MSKLNKGLLFSIVFHMIFLLLLTQQFFQTPLQTIKIKTIKPIQARLYSPPIKKQPIVVSKRYSFTIEKVIPTDEKVIITPRIEKIAAKAVNKPSIDTSNANTPPKIFSKQKISKKVLTSDRSKISITQTSLEKFKKHLNTQVQEDSQNDSFNQYLTEKNTITPSITKFNQLPTAKAKIKEVDCNNSKLNTAVTAISGLLGGSVRCNSMPNLKRFLDKRNNQRGK